MESLRIKNKDVYRIEVNDKGEFIEFDLKDVGSRLRLFEALDKIEEVQKEFNEKVEKSMTEKEMTILENEMFAKMREAMDIFLGKNGCQKIFGDSNYYEMYADLLKELNRKRPELGGKSHLDKMGMSAENIRKRIQEKYSKNQKKVI